MWKHPSKPPENLSLCLIVVNNKILLDFFFYQEMTNCFICGDRIAVPFNEVSAFCLINDLPLPDFIEGAMLERRNQERESIKLAEFFIKENRNDLFGIIEGE